jgi:hypothetical protein
MRGAHPRLLTPQPDEMYVAALDVAGQDEATTDPIAQLANPARDYTVATVFRVIPPGSRTAGILPAYEAVDVFVDHGSRHFQDHPGRPALIHRLLAYLNHWRVAHVIADATGVGEGIVDWLAGSLGPTRVTPFKFTPLTKAQLGSSFLSLVETGRFKYWTDPPPSSVPCTLTPVPGSSADPDSTAFFLQAASCSYSLPPDGQFDRHLKWGVPPTATVSTPTGPQPVHDDRLLSAALIAVYDDLAREGALSLGRAASALIPPPDPLSRLRF